MSVPVYASTTADVVNDKNNPRAGSADAPSVSTYLFTDPVHHRLIEVNGPANGQACPASGSQFGPQGYSPALWAAYDLNTYTLADVGCGLPDVSSTTTIGVPGGYETGAVMDPEAGVLMVPCLEGTPGNGCSGRSMILAVPSTGFSKGTATVSAACVGSAVDGSTVSGILSSPLPPPPCSFPEGWPLSLSAQPYQYLHALSWYAPTDDVLALTDNAQLPGVMNGVPGVAVSDYHVVPESGGRVRLQHRWTEHIAPPLCMRSLDDSSDWTGAAYRSENADDPALFVACTSKVATLSPSHTTVIVKIPLSRACTDGTPACAPASDPLSPGDATVVAAPFPGQGWLFDPAGERGFLLPNNANATGVSIAVYDGQKVCVRSTCALGGSFMGRFTVGGKALLVFGLDRATGRLYADEQGDPNWGLSLTDGRRTPTIPYAPITTPLTTVAGWGTPGAAIAGPDSVHPYTRIFLPLLTDYNAHMGGFGRVYMRSVTVVADRLPVSHDPPASQADVGTFTGNVPPGASLAVSTYSVNAAGYGLHSVSVGGYGGLVHNNDPFGISENLSLPSEAQSLDLALGAVGGSTLRDGVAEATSSAAFDVNSIGEQTLHACSDVSAPQGCQPPQCPLFGIDLCNETYSSVTTAEPAPAKQATQSQSTAQDWPYPVAQCSQPGPESLKRQEVRGVNQTPFRDASPDSSATPSPPTKISGSATASGARAVADCGNGATTAIGRYQCAGVKAPPTPDPSASPVLPSLPPLPGPTADPDDSAPESGCSGQSGTLTVTGAWTSTRQLPPIHGVVETDVTATAYGVSLALADGTVVEIQQITQTAKAMAGGRPGTATTQRSVVLSGVTVISPGRSPLTLQSPDSAALLDGLNTVDPSHMYATLPVPDERFGVEEDGVSPKGSPGGYFAAVRANPAQAQGDAEINGMTGFGGGESKFVPALRLVLFNPGEAQISREVLDFAGVEADAQLGVQLDENGIDDGSQLTTDTTQDMIQAGFPPSSTFVPGHGEIPNFPKPPLQVAYHDGLLGVLERALGGVGWLFRSPLAGLQMAAFLTLLGVPFVLMRRRWTWRIPTRGEV